MENSTFSPEKSLQLISEVIQEAKNRQQENGLMYLYWGIITVIAGLGHYYFNSTAQYQYIFFAYLVFPVAAAGMFVLFPQVRQKASSSNVIGTILNRLWMLAGLNMAILGFGFATVLTQYLIPIIMMLLGIAVATSGAAVQNRALFWGGVLTNLLGIGCFMVEPLYQPLMLALAAVTSQIVPGILLYQAYVKRQHV